MRISQYEQKDCTGQSMIADLNTDTPQGYRKEIGAQSATRLILTLEEPEAPLSLSGQLD